MIEGAFERIELGETVKRRRDPCICLNGQIMDTDICDEVNDFLINDVPIEDEVFGNIWDQTIEIVEKQNERD